VEWEILVTKQTNYKRIDTIEESLYHIRDFSGILFYLTSPLVCVDWHVSWHGRACRIARVCKLETKLLFALTSNQYIHQYINWFRCDPFNLLNSFENQFHLTHVHGALKTKTETETNNTRKYFWSKGKMD